MSAEQVECGCRLVHRMDGKVAVTPCCAEHRDLALKVRQPGSVLVVKPVPRPADRPVVKS